MVANPRTAHGSGRIRSLNAPTPVTVEADEQGLPRRVRLGRSWVVVQTLQDRWRLDDEWWRDRPVRREYWRVTFSNGREAILYHDMLTDRWLKQSYG